MKSVMMKNFGHVPSIRSPRSKFNLSHGYKTNFDAGYLYPFFIRRAYPGDTFNVSMTNLTRLATPIFPVMDNMFLDTQFFFVPHRLVWDNFEKFMGAQINPGDSTDYLVPQVIAGEAGFGLKSIFDYAGEPWNIPGLDTDALLYRSMNLIFNEWYRDENLQDSLPVHTDDGPDPVDDYNIFRRGKRFDYFTSMLTSPQKGPAVTTPIGSSAPVILRPLGDDPFYPSPLIKDTSGNVLTHSSNYDLQGSAADGNLLANIPAFPPFAVIDPNGTLAADLSEATAATINDQRAAFALQQYFEIDARNGTRYIEKIFGQFGVTSSDARLQRPEYLGGGSQVINVNAVMQTSATQEGSTPQGNLAAYGVSTGRHGFNKSFEEHGYVIGFLSVRADLNYQQGQWRERFARTPEEWMWPVFSNLGEQAVFNREWYAQGPSVVDANDVPIDSLPAGYQERYAEHRFHPSIVTADMRSNSPLTLDAWHLAQDFETLPALGPDFIVDDPPIDRVIAVPGESQFISDMYIRFIAARVLPTYSVPAGLSARRF